ncbi:recombinase family protein [Anaerocolumna chitinilytica]|uniref:Recombinase family protein n=1 Tax=Anaerocolumna chitinilytica TaxID=1727145 RepID=A0A7I8DK84_9FIRM|nr:recombinase family protein [Anaerocolumna chitinilytica]BCJ98077.1 hypothetical protein bsdcttw_11180 [Anaerocolumna chitinilytica]
MRKLQIAALYIRVSTDKQEELSPDAQKRLLLEYASKNDMSVPEEFIFIEGGISGKKADKRPKFQQMIALAKSKDQPIDVILVWKFSRFARNQEESIVYKSLLKKNNVDVVSISEPLIDGPFGSLIERIIEWMDEYYSIRLSGEVFRGMSENALRGGYQASPPLGYKVLHSGEPPVIIPEEAELIKLIFQKYVYEGYTFYQIAKYMNSLGYKTKSGGDFERRSIEYIIQNPTYAGYSPWNRTESETKKAKDKSEWIIEKGEHVPIISEDLFEQAMQRFTKEYIPKNARPESEYKHWLSGVVKCAHCGRSMIASKVKHSQYMHFSCNGYAKGKCKYCNSISESKLLPFIFDTLTKVITTGDVEYSVIRKREEIPEYLLLEQQLLKLIEKEKRVKNAYLNGVDTLEEYKQNKTLIQKEQESIQAQIDADKARYTEDTKPDMLSRIRSVNDIIHNNNIDNITKNKAIKSVIEKIIFNKEEGLLDVYFYYS